MTAHLRFSTSFPRSFDRMARLLSIALWVALLPSPCLSAPESEPSPSLQIQAQVRWRPVPDAISYDLRVLGANSTVVHSSERLLEAHTTLRLAPGVYTFELRSRDPRDIPGVWSKPQVLTVKKPVVEIISPKPKQIFTSASDLQVVDFEFSRDSVQDTDLTGVIKGQREKFERRFLLTGERQRLELPVGNAYSLQVQSEKIIGGDTAQPVVLAAVDFEVLGSPLEPPVILWPAKVGSDAASAKVRVESPPTATTTVIQIQGLEPSTRQWGVLLEQRFAATESAELSVADYREKSPVVLVTAQSFSTKRSPSSVSSQVLDSRTATDAQERIDLETTFKRHTDRTFFGGYILAQNIYDGVNLENFSRTQASGLTGTATLGLSDFSSFGTWGHQHQIDLGGTMISGRNQIFLKAKSSAAKRWSLGATMDLRASLGLRYGEIPEFILTDSGSVLTGKLSAIGPTVKAEFWRYLTGRYSLQLSYEFFQGLFGRSPGRKSLSNAMEQNIGVQLGVRLFPRSIGFLGWSRGIQSATYPGRSRVGNLEGDNEIRTEANYLFMSYEWWPE